MLRSTLHEGRLQDLLDRQDRVIALAGRQARRDEFLDLMWHSTRAQIVCVLRLLLYTSAELFSDFGQICQILL